MKRGIQALALFGITLAMSSGCNRLQNRNCNSCNGPLGCRPCNVAWQRGGTDYGAHLSYSQFHGNPDSTGTGYGAQMSHNQYRQDPNVGSGVPAPATAYPYYTTRGPRDFFVNNPNSIGR